MVRLSAGNGSVRLLIEAEIRTFRLEIVMRGLGLITLVCTALYSVPPTSMVGAILWVGYLGSVIISHV